MEEKKSRKQPELPQPKPDVVLPDDNTSPNFQEQNVLRMPSPRSDLYRDHF